MIPPHRPSHLDALLSGGKFSGEFINLLEQVNNLFTSTLMGDGPLWFRGHASSRWALLPRLHRTVIRVQAYTRSTLPAEEQLRRVDHGFYRQYVSNAWPLLAPIERTKWGSYLAMQHYSHDTRLLDWTENFLCAMYFAQSGRDPEDEAAIWVLRPEACNEALHGRAGLVAVDDLSAHSVFPIDEWHPTTVSLPEKPVAIQPLLLNPRMVAQRSRFTVTGSSFSALDELVSTNVLRKLTLSSSTFEDTERFLRICGMNAYSVFPDSYGLASMSAQKQRAEEELISTIAALKDEWEDIVASRPAKDPDLGRDAK